MTFISGWSPEMAARAAARRAAGVVPVLTVGRFRGALPNAWYNPSFRFMAQGIAGTCWLHGAVAAAEDTAKNALGLEPFPISRHYLGWYATQTWEGGRNPSDGGDPSDALAALIHAKGGGAPHESLDPYTDDYRTLGSRPPQAAIDDARNAGFDALVEAHTDNEACALIATGHTLANAVSWPADFDPQVPRTFFDSAGQIIGGHALAECGYLRTGGKLYICLRNWHGRLYRALPTELARSVPNYPYQGGEQVPDLWVEAGLLNSLRGDYMTRLAPTQAVGLAEQFELLDLLPC